MFFGRSILKTTNKTKKIKEFSKILSGQMNFLKSEFGLKLSAEIKRSETLLAEYKRVDEQRDYWRETAKKYKQALDKLKIQLEQSMYLSEGTLIEYSNRKNLKYIKALKEIESLCKDETCDPCKELEENDNCDECHCKIILDIIEEARGTNANKTRK